jgi:hypothetical protein
MGNARMAFVLDLTKRNAFAPAKPALRRLEDPHLHFCGQEQIPWW